MAIDEASAPMADGAFAGLAQHSGSGAASPPKSSAAADPAPAPNSAAAALTCGTDAGALRPPEVRASSTEVLGVPPLHVRGESPSCAVVRRCGMTVSRALSLGSM